MLSYLNDVGCCNFIFIRLRSATALLWETIFKVTSASSSYTEMGHLGALCSPAPLADVGWDSYVRQLRPCAEYIFPSFCAFGLSVRSLGLLVRDSCIHAKI